MSLQEILGAGDLPGRSWNSRVTQASCKARRRRPGWLRRVRRESSEELFHFRWTVDTGNIGLWANHG